MESTYLPGHLSRRGGKSTPVSYWIEPHNSPILSSIWSDCINGVYFHWHWSSCDHIITTHITTQPCLKERTRPPRHHPCVALTRSHSVPWLKTKLFDKLEPVGKLPIVSDVVWRFCKVACHVRMAYCRPGKQKLKVFKSKQQLSHS